MSDKRVFCIFTYAPTGLGHLRVMDALIGSMPKISSTIFSSSDDELTGYIHRFMSIHYLTRMIMEKMQSGILEDVFTKFYRKVLRTRTGKIYKEIKALISSNSSPSVVIISTHFGLAHQVAAVKAQLEKVTGKMIYLVVQVTDDSPQKIWYVPGCDLTFVPSNYTKEELLRYGRNCNLDEINIEVAAYPLCSDITVKQTEEEYQQRLKQLDFAEKTDINLLVPISGAAVGQDFTRKFIQRLSEKSQRIKFIIVSKKAIFTRELLKSEISKPNRVVHAFDNDRMVVDYYEKVLTEEVISLEITKPSEQSFKALISPRRAGGVTLLFTTPVGRQEWDNLDFLIRNKLIAEPDEQQLLLDSFKKRNKYELPDNKAWRGFILPGNPVEAADYVWWLMGNGILLDSVRHYKEYQNVEINSEGVGHFWKKVEQMVRG